MPFDLDCVVEAIPVVRAEDISFPPPRERVSLDFHVSHSQIEIRCWDLAIPLRRAPSPTRLLDLPRLSFFEMSWSEKM